MAHPKLRPAAEVHQIYLDAKKEEIIGPLDWHDKMCLEKIAREINTKQRQGFIVVDAGSDELHGELEKNGYAVKFSSHGLGVTELWTISWEKLK